MSAIGSLVADLSRLLEPVLDESGKVLYSAAATLGPGDLYLLGLNPGGDPAHPDSRTVRESLEGLERKRENDYLDEAWANRRGTYPPGAHPLQRRVRLLLEGLGRDPAEVCASNLIFIRSPGAEGAGYPEKAHLCWPAHERILALVRPKAVVAFGNSSVSPFRYLLDRARSVAHGEVAVESVPAGHGTWECRAFAADLGTGPLRVVGLPHLSWYSPAKPEILSWIRERVGS